jgi:hypothetical protein
MKQILACAFMRSGKRWNTGPISISDFSTISRRQKLLQVTAHHTVIGTKYLEKLEWISSTKFGRNQDAMHQIAW